MEASMLDKDQFINNSGMVIGAVQMIGPRNEPQGIPVSPGSAIWLSEEEQRLTARAPMRPEDNPFRNGLELVRSAEPGAAPGDRWIPRDDMRATATTIQEPPVSDPTPPVDPAPGEITGNVPRAAGDGATGVRAAEEVVGGTVPEQETPQAGSETPQPVKPGQRPASPQAITVPPPLPKA